MSTQTPRRFKVLVTRNIPPAAIDLLANKCDIEQWAKDDPIPREVLIEKIRPVDALFCLLTDKIDEEVLDEAEKLKVIGTMSVGYDHLDLKECRKRNLKLGYTPDVLTEATAELTVALTLCTARRLIEANRQIYSGGWGTWGPMWMCGHGIINSTIGIVGLGRIGYSVAEKLSVFRPNRILYFNRKRNHEAESKLHVKYKSLHELLERSDFVIVCCALNEQTKHMFSTQVFKTMKTNAILINTSRGPLVDQESLYVALTTGQIAAAGLGVCYPEPLPSDHKLLQLDNCVILPHIGSATMETRESMAVLAAQNILAALEDKPMPTPIPL